MSSDSGFFSEPALEFRKGGPMRNMYVSVAQRLRQTVLTRRHGEEEIGQKGIRDTVINCLDPNVA